MNTDTIKYTKEFYAGESARYLLCSRILDSIGDKLSDTAVFSPNCYIAVSVYNREDLAVIMTLAPVWSKSAVCDGIDYEAMVDKQRFVIQAKGEALPGTCKLVEEDYEVPATELVPAKPARIEKRLVLKCLKNEESPANA